MDNNENEENIQLLKEIIQSDRKKVAVFVGAGPSVPLGIKDWKKLLVEMGKKLDSKMSEKRVEELIIKYGYPGAASEIYHKINSHKDYLQFLHDQFEPKNCNFTSLHLKIVDRFQTILTTNFDSSFEKAFNDREKRFNRQRFPNFNPFTLFDERTVVYLHGNNDENKYIFRKEEYDVYYPSISRINAGSYELENFLKDTLSKISLVFIGFSFNDTYFTSFLKMVLKEESKENIIHEKVFRKEHPRKSVDHFVIIPNDNSSDIEEIKNIGLKVILYEKGKHVQIENIIDKLMPTIVGENIEKEAANAR